MPSLAGFIHVLSVFWTNLKSRLGKKMNPVRLFRHTSTILLSFKKIEHLLAKVEEQTKAFQNGEKKSRNELLDVEARLAREFKWKEKILTLGVGTLTLDVIEKQRAQ